MLLEDTNPRIEILPRLEGGEAAGAWYGRRDGNERMRMPLAVEASIGG